MNIRFHPSFQIALVMVLFWTHWTAAQVPQLKDEDEMIMSLTFLDGSTISDAMTVYRLGNEWYLPLGLLLEGLNVPISVSPSLGKAEGDFLEATRHFSLDKSRCQVEVHSKLEDYECSKTISHDEEIYVESKLLESWFPIHFKIDSFASQMTIESPLKFPEQARREREKMAEALASLRSDPHSNDYEFHPFPPRDITTPTIDQQITASYDQTKKTNFQQDTAASMEILGFESRGFIGGSEKKVDQWSLGFTKKDPQGDLLGNLHAREIQAFDLNMPTLPLISSSTRARGLLISNFSLSQPTNFTTKEFRGPLPSGWEVELYQNDILTGRQAAGASTEYQFKDLQLAYGVNRFRLVFYGPQGQRKEQVETINIGQSLNRPGEKSYRGAIGSLVDSNGNTASENRTLFQYQQGLSPDWSFAGSYMGIENSELSAPKPVHYGLLGVYGSLSRLFFSLNMAANDDSGQAIEPSLQAPFQRGSIGASYTSLSNFHSDLYNSSSNQNLEIQEIGKVNASWGFADFLALRLTGEVMDRRFEDHRSTSLTQRSSWKTGPLLWFNTFTHDPETSPPFSGQLSSISNLSGYEIRPSMDYSTGVDSIAAAVQKHLTDKIIVEVGARDSYKEGKRDYSMTFNRLFRNFTLSAEAGLDSTGNYKVSGLLSYSMMLDPAYREPCFFSQPQTAYGAVSAHVFLDLDQSGTWTPGDTPLEGIELLVNQNETHVTSDSAGHILLSKLPAYEFVDLSISSKTLSDPLYKPAKKGIRIVPRPGNTFEIDFPVIIQSEVDGLIQISSSRHLKGKSKMEVQLRDAGGKVVGRSVSESDGFFVIENISQGEYELLLAPDQLKMLNFRSRPESYKISVPATGLNNSSFDFSLEKVQ